MRNITEVQQRLIALGYPVGPAGADGKFGHNSLDAFNRFRASKGLGPVVNTSMEDLNRLLFPEEQPAPPPKKSNPIQDWLLTLAIKQGSSKLKGLLPMAFLTGYKTFATAAVIAIMGLYSLVFGELPLVGQTVDPGSAILALLSSLGIAFGRVGAKTEAKKAVGE